MKLKVVIHEAQEGGYWAEVPSVPGCATQAESLDELMKKLHEAVEGCISADGDVEAIDDVSVESGNITFEPMSINQAEVVRSKLATLGIEESDVNDAVAWARGTRE